ncbi:type I-E CRISPR-associated protein Cse2/CasB [Streptomyces sp. QH1-20]|uniref:type I-E CRISPR-associated protein Cse2/CasB n=1 Tax=Streptomyces sp. QH1-20 TaxID=3240934 RepID=UPI0035195885
MDAIARISARDPGARAALRSGLGKGLDEVPRMHRIVAPLLPPQILGDDDAQRAFYTVAALLAAQKTGTAGREEAETDSSSAQVSTQDGTGHLPAPTTGPVPGTMQGGAAPARSLTAAERRHAYGESLGLAYAGAVSRGTRDGIRESAAETRLNLLTRQSVAGIHRHIPAAVRQLCDKKCPPDWARLLVDLRAWPRDRKGIARRWLQDFYRARRQDDLNAARTADDTPALPAEDAPSP